MLAKNLKEFHRLVCERDGYICQVCKKSFNFPHYFDENGINQYVCGHHIETQGARIDLKLEVDNGRCVDFDCHEKLHRGQVHLSTDTIDKPDKA